MTAPGFGRWELSGHPDGPYTFEINPKEMSSPFAPRVTQTHISRILQRTLVFRSANTTHRMTFSGLLRSRDQEMQLRKYAAYQGTVQLTDHFGRIWSVVIESLQVNEQRPSPRHSYKATYTMSVYVLGGLL